MNHVNEGTLKIQKHDMERSRYLIIVNCHMKHAVCNPRFGTAVEYIWGVFWGLLLRIVFFSEGSALALLKPSQRRALSNRPGLPMLALYCSIII